MQADSPGIAFKRFAERDIEITGQTRIQRRFSHHLITRFILALLWIQYCHQTLIFIGTDLPATGTKIGALNIVETIKTKLITGHRHPITRNHTHIFLHVIDRA